MCESHLIWVMSHMSYVTWHVSHVTWDLSINTCGNGSGTYSKEPYIRSKQPDTHAQKSPIHTQKGPIHTQKSPIHTQKSPVYIITCALSLAAMAVAHINIQKSTTGWLSVIGSLIFIGHFPQESPKMSGSFSERDLQLKAFCASSPLCIFPLS